MFIKIIKFLKCLRDLKLLCSFRYSGMLSDYGWWESYKGGLPVDKEGNPIPWVTYPFIEFIKDRLNKNLEVFEYGSGNSTLWYAKKVRFVTSVEHEKIWYEKIKSNMLSNISLNYIELDYRDDYSKFPLSLNKRFNIVIVDGRDRVNCLINSVNVLENDGVIVLDDSERESYAEGVEFLLNRGFKRIDFWGISPRIFFRKCTTIFYKRNNCLGI